MPPALLLCDNVPPDYRAKFGTYQSFFETLISTADPSIQLTPYRCHEGAFPARPGDHTGYVISGSRAGVYESDAWIGQLANFVRAAFAQNIPLLGICFGHQMIAHALGGRTEKAAVGWGLGLQKFDLAPAAERPAWMQGGPDHYHLPCIFQDQVVQVPPGFEVLASNDFCPHGCIYHPRALGIQGHPEFSKAYTLARTRHLRERAGEDAYQLGVASLSTDADSCALRIGKWCAAFLREASA